MRTQSLVVALVFAAAAPLAAQAPATSPTAPHKVEPDELRHQIYVMEGALARAVAFGAQRLNQEIRDVMPDLLVLAGDANARGFYLDGHGVFFDVEVPVLRQSMMWSLRMMLDQDQQGARTALAQLKRHIEQPAAEPARQPRHRAPPIGAAGHGVLAGCAVGRPANAPNPFAAAAAAANGASAQPVSSGAPATLPASQAAPRRPIVAAGAELHPCAQPVLDDPGRAYTEWCSAPWSTRWSTSALPMVSSMQASEWLTVAARDNERRDPWRRPTPTRRWSTVMLRIKGSDLAAYRAGTIDRDEARKRVAVKEF